MNNKEKGCLGERIAEKYIERAGYKVLERNYRKMWGELDIIAERGGVVNFFEVKSVTSDMQSMPDHAPEENVHGHKVRQIRRMIETYMSGRYGAAAREFTFEFHIICVYLDMKRRCARVRFMKNVIL